MWKRDQSDVYLATRTLGGAMKASIHASGTCHIRAPAKEYWRSPGEAPRYLETWQVNTGAQLTCPFGVIIPESELRVAGWPPASKKPTIWIPLSLGQAIEVSVFLVRLKEGEAGLPIVVAGTVATIADAPLPDGRRLLVVARPFIMNQQAREELERVKATGRLHLGEPRSAPWNPRILATTAGNEHGTRHFIEASLLPNNAQQQ